MQRKSWKKVLTSFALKQKCEQVKLFKSWGKTFEPQKNACFLCKQDDQSSEPTIRITKKL